MQNKHQRKKRYKVTPWLWYTARWLINKIERQFSIEFDLLVQIDGSFFFFCGVRLFGILNLHIYFVLFFFLFGDGILFFFGLRF